MSASFNPRPGPRYTLLDEKETFVFFRFFTKRRLINFLSTQYEFIVTEVADNFCIFMKTSLQWEKIEEPNFAPIFLMHSSFFFLSNSIQFLITAL